jgi:antitoxin (DNA-binding transcriptional repressor) of toxin-antitoxin stability system
MRESVGRLDALVEQEGELIIRRRGKAIARVLPVSRQRTVTWHGYAAADAP